MFEVRWRLLWFVIAAAPHLIGNDVEAPELALSKFFLHARFADGVRGAARLAWAGSVRRSVDAGTARWDGEFVAIPLIATKMYVPKVRGDLVMRDRLLTRVSRGSSARVVLVSGPPGFGKTTLLAEWAQRASSGSQVVAWVSLDATDNDPASFWAYVVASLGAAVPTLGSAGRDLVTAGHVTATQMVTTLINELSVLPEQAWLVLDDFHRVDNPEVVEGVNLLVEHLPGHVHVLIGTRRDPDLPLSRWRARGDLVEIRAADLRFTGEETVEYLRSAAEVELTAADIARLGERTEGWIAALQLAALSLRGRRDASAFIERFAGDDRYIVDYLMDEVLAHQSGEVADFLLLTAVLGRLTGGLCDAVTGLSNGSGMLAALERANLFVVPLDDQAIWFRYHHLFADVLRARLIAERPERVPLLHRRASSWYEASGLTDEAIGHALAAGDVDKASHLAELALPDARRNRQDAMLTRWLRALPVEVVARNPVLTVFHGWTLMATGDLSEVESRLSHAERLLDSVRPGSPTPWADTNELRTLPATIAIYRASLAQARGDMATAAAHARHAIDVAGPNDHLARGGATGFLALAAWSAGEIALAVDTFTSTVDSLHAAETFVDELSSTAVLAEMLSVAGRPGRARELCLRALQQAVGLGPMAARAAADLHVELAELDLDAGAPAAAERHLQEAEPLEQQVPAGESRHRWFVAEARLAAASGEYARVVFLLDQAQAYYQPGYYPNVRPIAAMRARAWISGGDLARAAEWAVDQGVAVADEASYLAEYDHLTLARLILAQPPGRPRDLDGLVFLLQRLEAAAERSGRDGSLIDIRTQLELARAAVLGEVPAGPVAIPGVGEFLTARELQVLRLLDSGLSGPEIARELFVSHNTLRSHTKHIFTKLDVTTRRAAVLRAQECGLL